MALLEKTDHMNEYKSLSPTEADGPKPTKSNQNNLLISPGSMNIHNEANTSSTQWYKDYRNYIKICIILTIIVFIIIAIVYSRTTSRIFNDFLKWMQDNAVEGSFAFIAIYFCCTVLMIPGSILTLGAGFVFRQVLNNEWLGILLAAFIVFIAASLGAIVAFVLGRFVFREKVASYKQKYEKFDIIDRIVEHNGFKVTLLLRLTPIIPFNVFNYAMGLTSVTLKSYSCACIGIIPGTLAYCFIGGSLNALADASAVGFSNPTVLILTIVGTVITIIGMIYMGYIAKREFNKMADEFEQDI